MLPASGQLTCHVVRNAGEAYANSIARTMIQLPTLGPSEANNGKEEIMSKRKSSWHQVHGKGTRSLGERGMRVRLFQKRKGGTFYREVWVTGHGKSQASLGTADRDEAEQIGRAHV